jgi:uncharacterized protein (UPF0335 family)
MKVIGSGIRWSVAKVKYGFYLILFLLQLLHKPGKKFISSYYLADKDSPKTNFLTKIVKGLYIMSDNVAADQLRLLIERVERLEEEKKGISADIKDVYGEAKSVGYDTKIMKQIVRLRRMEKDARDEADALLETYRAALGL